MSLYVYMYTGAYENNAQMGFNNPILGIAEGTKKALHFSQI